MATVTFVETDGTTHQVEGAIDRSIMQIAIDNSVPGILGDCGGLCSCATCHGYIKAPWSDKLPPILESESFMLEGALERRECSRLCCQIKMHADLDGIVVHLPAAQA
jgi:ferredoxin, 2Fe-2S